MRGRQQRLTRGDQLSAEARRDVLAAYVHRFQDRSIYTPEMDRARREAADEEWLSAKAFYTRADGRLDGRYTHCEPVYLADDYRDAVLARRQCPHCRRDLKPVALCADVWGCAGDGPHPHHAETWFLPSAEAEQGGER